MGCFCGRLRRPEVRGELERERLTPLEEEDLEEGEEEFELAEPPDPDRDLELSEFEGELSSLRPPTGDRERRLLRRPVN